MNKNKLTFLKIAIVAVLGGTTLIGCEKEEVKEEEKVEVKNNKEVVSINGLKKFMSELTGIDVKEIEYNSETTFFVWKGVNQITKDQLLLAYEQSKNI